MKTKSFLVFSVSVFATSALLIVFHSQRPDSIESIVSQTHRHIKNFQENLKDVEETNLVQEERYLRLLGVDSENAGGGGDELWHNTSVPCLVSYALGDAHEQAVGLIRNVHARLPHHTLLFYNLGLAPRSLAAVSSYCNSSRCVLLELELDAFPPHVAELDLHAFRPLIVQHALSRVGGVLFLESDQRFVGSEEQLRALYGGVAAAGAGGGGGGGVLAWPRRPHPAVSSLTHPRMFHYFHTDADSFLFLPMVDMRRLLVASSADVQRRVMLPWLRCALTHDCILPIGAQSGGCRFDKKPQYRYSGCHSNDVSALNIALGLRYELDETCYTYTGSAELFARVGPERARADFLSLQRNATDIAPTTATVAATAAA